MVADVADRDRLQPSLLDRLTDDHPTERTEARDRQVITQQRLRELILRDLSWLLNTSCLASVQDLEGYPLVVSSTLNYGIRDLTGQTAASIDGPGLERLVRQAIRDFEPRILPETLEVRVINRDGFTEDNTLAFDIEGALWGQPVPIHIYLRTEIDLADGDVKVSDANRRGAG